MATAAAAATPSTVTGTTTALSVLGADIDPDEGNLTYTWAATTLPSGAAAPTFIANGTNAAKNTTATFSAAGTYVFTVTIADPGGLSVTSNVSVTVNQTLTSITVSPRTGEPQRGGDAAIHGDRLRPVRHGPDDPAHIHLDDDRGHDQPGGTARRPPVISASGTVTAGYPLAGGGTVSGTSAVTVTEHAPTVADGRQPRRPLR